jgi:hypothetical protein
MTICPTLLPGQICGGPSQPVWDLRLDPSRIDWVDLPVDVLGIAGDIGYATGHPLGQAVWAASSTAELLTVRKPWDELDLGDPTGVLLQITEGLVRRGKLPPLVGTLSNIVSIATNLASASYVEIDPRLRIGSPQWP